MKNIAASGLFCLLFLAIEKKYGRLARMPIEKPTNYKDTHRNKPENYFLGLLDIKGVLLIPAAFTHLMF
jgi:hypothetical protein